MHQQSLHQPLYHDPERFVVAIEVAYHAEQDGSGDGLGRKVHEVGVALGNNSGICRKQTGENITLAPHQCKYGAAETRPMPIKDASCYKTARSPAIKRPCRFVLYFTIN